jgi:DNA-directed RNA polymerase specialized sigma24 family protein
MYHQEADMAVSVAPWSRRLLRHISSAGLTPLDPALQNLESFAPRQGRIVQLHFPGGLSLQETAKILELSVGTVRRDWSLARACLYRGLNRKTP